MHPVLVGGDAPEDVEHARHEVRRDDVRDVAPLGVAVEDHAAALRFIHSALVPGGRAIVLVPAFQFLYGTIDAKIGHFRRYTRRDLLPRMREAGFVIEHSFYMNVIGMAGWFWNNRVRRIKDEDVGQIVVFDRFIAPWAEPLERLIPPPFGLSLIAIGRKEAHTDE